MCRFVEVLLKASLLLNLGAATVKDLDLRTAGSVRSADLREVVGVCKVKREVRRCQPMQCLKKTKQTKTNNKISKSILKRTGRPV